MAAFKVAALVISLPEIDELFDKLEASLDEVLKAL